MENFLLGDELKIWDVRKGGAYYIPNEAERIQQLEEKVKELEKKVRDLDWLKRVLDAGDK